MYVIRQMTDLSRGSESKETEPRPRVMQFFKQLIPIIGSCVELVSPKNKDCRKSIRYRVSHDTRPTRLLSRAKINNQHLEGI